MPDRLLPRYYWFQAVSTATLFQAVFFVYYAERAGLSVAAILWLQSFNTGLRAALDLPLGALADRVSRRLCLVGGSLGIAAGATVLLVWPSLAGACMAEALFAVAAALRSGADSALLHDTLHAGGRGALYPRAESRGQAAASIGSGAAAVLGGVLAGIDLALPYVASVATALAAARLAWSTPAVRWALAVAVLAVVGSHVYFYLQQPYLRAAGVPLALFGVVFAVTKLVTAAVAAVAHRIDRALGQRATVGAMAAVPACGLGAMAAVVGPAGAPLILTRGVLDGLWMPLLNVHMNRLVDSRLRATMLSLQSVLARLGLAVALAALGAATAAWGLRATLAGSAIVLAVAGAVIVGTAPVSLLRRPPAR